MTLTLEAIWAQFATRLRHFIRARVANDASAEDILQNVFVKIQQRLGTLRGAEKIEAWVHQIARHAIVDHFRAQRPAEELSEDLPQPGENTADEAEKAGLLAAFRRMITELPEPYRQAIQLTELEGLTQQELATRLGISLSGAKSRVQRGRAMLKAMLLECCRFEFDRRGGIMDCEPRKKAACAECGS
ncbi:MAG: RNA polymerase sigma factor SigZ [Verrucomicrobiaceae bacterium]|nr:RNA polymerase sigma factor SigZ [Verrucomicrobiaceae bacterium]